MKFAFFLGVALFAWQALSHSDFSSFEKDSSDYKLLVFLSKDCPCSRSHVTHLNQLSSEFKNISFYGVITDTINDNNSESIYAYYSAPQFTFPLLQDREQKLIKQYNALKTPHVILFKKQQNGLYTIVYEGGVSNHRDFPQAQIHFLKENLIAAQKNQPLPHTNGKSLGCYIRRF